MTVTTLLYILTNTPLLIKYNTKPSEKYYRLFWYSFRRNVSLILIEFVSFTFNIAVYGVGIFNFLIEVLILIHVAYKAKLIDCRAVGQKVLRFQRMWHVKIVRIVIVVTGTTTWTLMPRLLFVDTPLTKTGFIFLGIWFVNIQESLIVPCHLKCIRCVIYHMFYIISKTLIMGG